MPETEKTNAGRALVKTPRNNPIKTPGHGEAPEEPEASVLTSKEGTTIIHNDVVAKIAGMAVREVEGVSELVPYDGGQSVTKMARRVMGRSMRNLGIQVEVGKTQAAVDVRIVTEYGVSIVDIAHEIRRNVRTRIESMTGLECVEVNIEILDLHFREEDDDSDAGLDHARVQ